MKDEDRYAFDRGERLEGGIYTAVEAWCADRDAAKDQYGPIASWNTSEITDMSWLFHNMADFNEDISRWDVSNVTSMQSTFYGATSFDGDLSRCISTQRRYVAGIPIEGRYVASVPAPLCRWYVANSDIPVAYQLMTYPRAC